MKNNKKYRVVYKKYLAEALSFIGFRYYKYNDEKGTGYSFLETDLFINALNDLLELKNKYNIIK